MSQNRRIEHEAPVSTSEEEEEEEGSSEEQEEGSESEDKTSPPTPPVTKTLSASKIPETPVPDSSSSSSGSGSDSESDSPPKKSGKADPNIKPISSKPMDGPPKATKKPRSKPSVPTSPPLAKSTAGAKRPSESESKESKRVKKNIFASDNEADGAKKISGDDSKKQLFQRLWSEDDEIVILKGIMDYTAKKGSDPVADMNDFHDFIKKSLHIDVSKTQLSDKVRRLKKKYENNASKSKGKDKTFSKPHEQKAYELSKKIWGSKSRNEGNDVTAKVNGSAMKNQSQRGSKSAVSPKVDGLSSPVLRTVEVDHNVGPSNSKVIQFGRSIVDPVLEEEIIKDGLQLILGPKRVELEEKWRKLRVEEVELYLKRVELISEQTKLVVEALKSREVNYGLEAEG